MENKKIIQKLLEYDDQFRQIRGEIKQYKDETLTTLDQILTITKRLDQERLFTFEAVKRIQKEIEDHDKQIKKIKHILKIT